MIDRKMVLYVALGLVMFMLYTAWERDYPAHTPAQTTAQSQQTSTDVPTDIPSTPATTTTPAIQTAAPVIPARRLIEVDTDVLKVFIDRKGGAIVKTELKKYPVSYKEKNKPVVFLNNDAQKYFVVQSGLLSQLGPDTKKGQAVLSGAKNRYVLEDGQKELPVTLTWRGAGGVNITKTFLFKRGDYIVGVNYDVKNNSGKTWRGQVYGQIKRKRPPSQSILTFHTYTGGAISTTDKPYEKVSYDDMDKANLSRVTKGGWVVNQQRYFLTAFIPNAAVNNHIYSRVNGEIYTLGAVGPEQQVAAGKTKTLSSKVYVGPELGNDLKAVAPNLNLTIDYGWLWPISIAIFWVMDKIYKLFGNWGVSIILVTLLIKLAFYKLSESSFRSMAKMRKLAPQMERLKQQHGDDKAAMSQATMELYRREKVNPLGGCLPMVIQIPIFFALYYVLIESVQLRQAPFVFWIHDLSVKDPFYVLPLLMGLSMFAQQKMNPAPPDPAQAKMMMFMPVIFTVMFFAFPSGLVLYWLTNNVLTIAQQYYIMKKVG